jgi:hypothetical protein
MKLLLDVFTPDGKVTSEELTLEIEEPVATGWYATVDFEGPAVPGIYTARMALYFGQTYLNGFEGRVFDVTAAPTFSGIGAVAALAGLGIVAVPLTAMAAKVKEEV